MGNEAAPVAAAPAPVSTEVKVPDTKTAAPVVDAAKAAPVEQMVTLKVRGVDKQVPLSKALELAQKSDAADQVMQSAAQTEKAFNKLVGLVKTPEGLQQLINNPAFKINKAALLQGMLNSNDPDVVKIAEQTLFKKNVLPTLPEEQQTTFKQQADYEDLKAFKAAKDREAQEIAEQQKQQQQTSQQEGLINKFKGDIAKAMTETGLPMTPFYADRILHYAIASRAAGKPMDMASCAAHVKTEIAKENLGALSSRTDEEILALPVEVLKRLNDLYVKKIQGSIPEGSKKEMTKEEARKEWLKIKRGQA